MKSVKHLGICITKIVTVMALFSVALPTTYAADTATSSACREALLGPVKVEPLDDFVLANGVAVTGDFIYTVDMVLHDLGLDTATIQRLKDQSVLSLAEGISGLLPFLLNQGISARGLDLWYGSTNDLPNNYSGRLMREYVRKHGDNLIPGDARQIPLESESVDLVVSHMLVNNVEMEVQKNIVKDALRVAKKGGEVRLFGFDEDEAAQITEFLNANYRGKISFRFEEKKWDLVFRGRHTAHESSLLTIYKMRDGESSVLQ